MPKAAEVAKVPESARAADAALTIIRLFRAMERVDAGLTPQQYRVLKLIGAGGERSARLADRLAVAKPTLTSTADNLVAAGLLSREADSADRRVVRLRLTDAGQAAVDHADGVYVDWLGALLGAAGDPDRLLTDFDLLDHAIDQLRTAKRASAAEPAPQVPE
jgi:DNA-binding MarR family transcriptional regulator